MNDETGTYKILSSRLPKVAAKFEKLNRRAEKLGVPGVSFKVENTYTEEKRVPPAWDEFGVAPASPWVKVVNEYADVSFQGEAPKIEGWEFCAVIEPLGKDANILRVVPGVGELPEKYRTAPNGCDHCHTNRRRKATYVVRETATGTYKKVGSTCIQDFLGGKTPDQILATLEIILSAVACFGDEEESGFGSGGRNGGYNLEDFLAVSSAIINKTGYVSRKACDEDFSGSKTPTGSSVLTAFGSRDYEIVFETVDAPVA